VSKINNSGIELTSDLIKTFEIKNNIKFTELYTKFLLENNGGYPEKSTFKISDVQGESVLNIFYGIDMYDNISDYLDIYEGRISTNFIPIADDSGGNVICLGIDKEYYEKIYFWDHENETEDMSNMYYLSSNIYEFVENLY
jgi:hypothetical protein